MTEYFVAELSADPEVATKLLNELSVLGWQVVGMYHVNRAILERDKPAAPAAKGK